MLKSIQENWPVLSGSVGPLLAIDFSTFGQTIIYAAITTLTSLIVKGVYDKYIKKIFK